MGIVRRLGHLRALGSAPRLVLFAITSHCNACCTTCSFPRIPAGERRHADYGKTLKALDFLAKNGVRMVSITGGEPLTHPRFLDICRAIDERGLIISYIATNGILLDEAVVRELSRMDVNMVGLSMDITRPDGTGRTRRYDVVGTVRRAKRLLDRYGVPCYAGVLPGRTPEDVKAVLAGCEELGFSRVVVSYPQGRMGSSYRAAAEGPDTVLGPGAVRGLVAAIRAEKRLRRRLSVFNTEVSLEELANVAGGGKSAFRCPAGRWQFYLDWDLELYRCFNDGLKLGSILELEDLEFECGECPGCTQQAYLDYAGFYRAYEFIGGLKGCVLGNGGGELRRLVSDRDNRRALRSTIETYLGGFV